MYSVTIVWSAFAFIHLRLGPHPHLHPAPAISHTPTPPTSPACSYCDPPFGAVECPAILQCTLAPAPSPPSTSTSVASPHTPPFHPPLLFSLHTLNVIYRHCFNCKDNFLGVLNEDTVDKCFILDVLSRDARAPNMYTAVLAQALGREVCVYVCVCVRVYGRGGVCRCGRQQGFKLKWKKKKKKASYTVYITVQFLYYSQCWFCYQSQTKM